MEAASLVLSIAALYTTCRDRYNFFTVVKTAETDSSAHLRELEIQQSILKAWGFHWQIHGGDGAESERNDQDRIKRTKLSAYLSSNRYKAQGLFSTLSALADTLSNQEKLIKRYGITLQPVQTLQAVLHSSSNVELAIGDTTIEDVKPVISEVKNRLSVLNKFKWAMKDRDGFKKLISDLKAHGDSLYRLCPENAFESMNIYLTMECLAKQESPASLKRTSQIASQHAQIDAASSVRDGYELLASAATLKASVNENRGGVEANERGLATVNEEQQKMWYLGKGLALFEDQVVYVEMRDYRGPPLELTAEQKQRLKRRQKRDRYGRRSYDDSDESDSGEPIESVRPADPGLRALISNFYNTFKGANMRERVFGLDIAGMIDHMQDESKGHCSILYKLPGTIGLQTRERPAGNLRLRAPVTLQALLSQDTVRGRQSALGKRFELARKLVRAVCVLHSSGWLHKNIRAESVMFFPEHVSALQEDKYELKVEIDVAKPILMGYIFSRPDDVAIENNASTLPRTKSQDQTLRSQTYGQPSTRPISKGPVPSPHAYIYTDPTQARSESRRAYRPPGTPGTPRPNNIYGFGAQAAGGNPEQAGDLTLSGFTLDYYQHPAKHADPKRLYRHAYDVYSLGILLLEIGLWEKLKQYGSPDAEDDRNVQYDHLGYAFVPTSRVTEVDDEDSYEQRRWICRKYLDRLRWQCGDAYADVVLRCLMIDSSDDEVGKASERELCARIVADLEGCRA